MTGLSAYRARKSALNARWANETLGARRHSFDRSPPPSNLTVNVRFSVFVTHSTHDAKLASRAPLTVSAPGRMVAMSEPGERTMADVTHHTPEAQPAAIHRGCAR